VPDIYRQAVTSHNEFVDLTSIGATLPCCGCAWLVKTKDWFSSEVLNLFYRFNPFIK